MFAERDIGDLIMVSPMLIIFSSLDKVISSSLAVLVLLVVLLETELLPLTSGGGCCGNNSKFSKRKELGCDTGEETEENEWASLILLSLLFSLLLGASPFSMLIGYALKLSLLLIENSSLKSFFGILLLLLAAIVAVGSSGDSIQLVPVLISVGSV